MKKKIDKSEVAFNIILTVLLTTGLLMEVING